MLMVSLYSSRMYRRHVGAQQFWRQVPSTIDNEGQCPDISAAAWSVFDCKEGNHACIKSKWPMLAVQPEARLQQMS